jgi:hypothetical protein
VRRRGPIGIGSSHITTARGTVARGDDGAIGKTVADIVATLPVGRRYPLPAPRIERPEHGCCLSVRRMGLRQLCKSARLDSLKTRV